ADLRRLHVVLAPLLTLRLAPAARRAARAAERTGRIAAAAAAAAAAEAAATGTAAGAAATGTGTGTAPLLAAAGAAASAGRARCTLGHRARTRTLRHRGGRRARSALVTGRTAALRTRTLAALAAAGAGRRPWSGRRG